MKNVKKFLSAIICMSICITTIPVQATLLNVETKKDTTYDIIQPRMQYISDVESNFYIKNGIATVSSYVVGNPSVTTKCEIEANLQVQSGYSWRNVATWNDEENGQRASIYETQSVVSGNKYRVVVEATAWSGSSSETETLISETIEA